LFVVVAVTFRLTLPFSFDVFIVVTFYDRKK